jgi:hypothetical protein
LKSRNLTLPLAGLLLVLTGCTESGEQAAADNPALAEPVPEGMVRGAVEETMDSGGYTYVLLETAEGVRWMAAKQTEVKVGDVLQAGQGMPMTKFHSNSLDRTFEVIYFVGSFQNLSAPALSAVTPGDELPEGHPSVDVPDDADAPAADVAAFEPGQDIAAVYANRESLAGQQFSLRGKVVKYNDGILGWNFIHIQDGSGDATDGSNDLTVTSKAATAVGDTVVVTGTIILDKDFGAGYSFPVMMEDASIAID